MKIIQKDVFVTDDGKEFIRLDKAVRHEGEVRALARIEALLFRMPDMRDVRKCWGDDPVNEVLTVLSDSIVTRPTSKRLFKILRQLEEGAPAAGSGPKEPNGQA